MTGTGDGARRHPPVLTVRPLPTPVEVEVGDDLAAVLLDAVARAGVTLRTGDVLAVASKVVAKAEGATVPLPPGPDTHARRQALARRTARRVVAEAPWVVVVETHHGLVCANAGIDTSNVDGDDVALLLPDDPDHSAELLRGAVLAATGATVGVLVTDTFGRPWRLGQTDVAIGAAGVTVLRDDRGTADRQGRTLDVTMAAVGDALAAAADLVRRKADGTPFVLLRGLDVAGDGTAADLVRPSAEDLFRAGGTTAAAEALAGGALALRDRDAVVTQRPPAGLVTQLAAAVSGIVGGEVTLVATPDGVRLVGDDHALGVARAAVLVVLGAHGLVAAVSHDAGRLDIAIGTAADA